jgi:hypothetical protein
MIVCYPFLLFVKRAEATHHVCDFENIVRSSLSHLWQKLFDFSVQTQEQAQERICLSGGECKSHS